MGEFEKSPLRPSDNSQDILLSPSKGERMKVRGSPVAPITLTLTLSHRGRGNLMRSH